MTPAHILIVFRTNRAAASVSQIRRHTAILMKYGVETDTGNNGYVCHTDRVVDMAKKKIHQKPSLLKATIQLIKRTKAPLDHKPSSEVLPPLFKMLER